MDMLIRCNVGPRERLVRGFIGAAAVAGAFRVHNRGLRAALGTLGFAGLATAITRYSPENQLLGIRNCQPAYRSVQQVIRRI
jgi:hypothetical protein